jgi:hypothetical protein
MRIVLYLALLMTALWCVAGGVGLTVYLVAIAARSVSDRRRGVTRSTSPPPRGFVALLIAYACFMAAVAALMVWARVPFWVGFASWSALVAFATAAVVGSRRSALSSQ